MKLYSIVILRSNVGQEAEPVVCTAAIDVSDFNIFQRGSAREFNIFLSKSVAKSIAKTPGASHQVKEGEHILFGVSRHDGLVAVAATDPEYNPRVAVTMLMSILGDFSERFRSQWEGPANPKDNYVTAFQSELDQLLVKYQNPTEADKILKIQKELAETKIIMHQAIDSLLERGAKIDELVQKSGELGTASKAFYKTAKKNNQCCIIS
eukprot:PhF_6_TR35761/c0_g1_i1/m.51957/K08516/YKT6; synaptobrevin homolog YKT6